MEQLPKDNEKNLSRWKKVKIGLGTTAAVGLYIAVAVGVEPDGGFGKHTTHKMSGAGEWMMDELEGAFDSAADTVTGIFRTAPDENGDSTEFTVEGVANLAEIMDIKTGSDVATGASLDDYAGIQYDPASTPELTTVEQDN